MLHNPRNHQALAQRAASLTKLPGFDPGVVFFGNGLELGQRLFHSFWRDSAHDVLIG